MLIDARPVVAHREGLSRLVIFWRPGMVALPRVRPGAWDGAHSCAPCYARRRTFPTQKISAIGNDRAGQRMAKTKKPERFPAPAQEKMNPDLIH